MSEDNKEIQQEAPAVDTAKLAEMLEALKSENSRLREDNTSILSKNSDLIGEKRKEQAKVADAADAKLRSKGDVDSLKQLLNSSTEKNKEWEDRYNTLENNISGEKIGRQALKIATELADSNNAELLSDFIARRLKYTSDGLKVLDKDGLLTVSTVEDLKNEFANSDRYKSLLRGIQSNGGGATGSSSGAGAANKELTRSEFQKLSPGEKGKFLNTDKGKVINN